MQHAEIDFETYSEAGFVWNEDTRKWCSPPNSTKKGLPAVGIAAYAEHPSTEVLCCAYDLHDGKGKRLWKPGDTPPDDLFCHVVQWGLIEAWNVSFERWIWEKVCAVKYHWPVPDSSQWRCAMAKSRAHALPGSLEKCGNVLDISAKKDKDGTRLLNKFSMPRNPTLKDMRIRIQPEDDPEDAEKLYDYCLRDIEAEKEISSVLPDLPDMELNFWTADQAINRRGVQVDVSSVYKCVDILEQAYIKYNKKIQDITNGEVTSVTQLPKMLAWVKSQGIKTSSLDKANLQALLDDDSLPDNVREVLTIRQFLGGAAVKKVYAILNQVTKSGRIHDLFVYHAARTGRAAGTGPQPQNLPNSGPMVNCCNSCGRHYPLSNPDCSWCGSTLRVAEIEWGRIPAKDGFEAIQSGSLACVEYYWNDALTVISGCLRGMFIAAPGHDLICSDYSAIEAVVLAALAGEEWRMEVFRTHGMIYEMSAAKITGVPFQEFIDHKESTGQHHPMRKKVGKIAELASGYAGWIGAWKQFGADQLFNDAEIKKSIIAWRNASPAIVEFWGGQKKNWKLKFYGIEGAAIQAVLKPGEEYAYRGITYVVRNDVLYCRLLSGRNLTYHRPRLIASTRAYAEDTYSLSYEGWNTNPKTGSSGWVRMDTFAGKLVENIVQATARDILAYAIVNLEKSGYPVVLHVHDEIVAEVKKDFGSVEEFEKIMSALPAWAVDDQGRPWPIFAKGGWRDTRYGK